MNITNVAELKAGLYIVSTPIGNLSDISFRAIETLKNSNVILCEDTRITKKLLEKYNISTKLRTYNDHSDENMRNFICSLIDQGHIISLVSDAGTPLISDPGYKLVRELKERSYHVDVVPGICSPIAALTLSGLPTDRFLFVGFLPKTTIAKRNFFHNVANIEASLIFFDTANRLLDSLNIAKEVFGNILISVARELTKLHQEVKTGTIDEIIEFYRNNILKGEIILIISNRNEFAKDKKLNLEMIETQINEYLNNNYSAKDITEILYSNFNKLYTKSELYNIVNINKSKKNQ
jgi:16S rRNA (cytidine1402-2'-O)-methyltransferase